jgi:glutamate N-acetyltransferase / amino-acid N-acetyltransferase
VKLRVPRPPIRVPGFRFAGIHCGLKSGGKPDVGLIVSERCATAVGAFTTNRVQAAPVRIGKRRLRAGKVHAILVNSGNANAYTGRDGEAVAREMTATVARALEVPESRVIPSSTGRIGIPLPRALVFRGVERAVESLSPDAFHQALEAMMTTDAFPKFALREITLGGRICTIAGMAKGAGMIAPRMATMLSYVLTDACVSHRALQAILSTALPESFNQIVVDGDTSTNDTVLLLANGVAGNRLVGTSGGDFETLRVAVTRIMRGLARAIVKDGEGATKVIDIVVRGARSVSDAERVADTIARSPLCKTAFYGGDPYAGRVVCAAGYSGARFDPAKLDVFLGEVPVVEAGVEVVGKRERQAARVARGAEFTLMLDLHAGQATARRMASDLTPDYVKFNSAYRT